MMQVAKRREEARFREGGFAMLLAKTSYLQRKSVRFSVHFEPLSKIEDKMFFTIANKCTIMQTQPRAVRLPLPAGKLIFG
jgi:hypothetical protein